MAASGRNIEGGCILNRTRVIHGWAHKFQIEFADNKCKIDCWVRSIAFAELKLKWSIKQQNTERGVCGRSGVIHFERSYWIGKDLELSAGMHR